MKKKRLLTNRSGELEEQMLAEKARELSEEIDAGVLRLTFRELGWHEIVLTPMSWEEGYNIDSWVEENIKRGRWTYGLVWMFEDSKDANWFKLRWLS